MLKLGLIGCGKMGGALLRGVEKSLGKANLSVALSDVVPQAVEALVKDLQCPVTTGTPTGKVYVTSPETKTMTIIRTDIDTVDTTIPLQGNGVQVRVTAP